MASLQRLDASRASGATLLPHDDAVAKSDSYELHDIDDELKRLSAATQQLLGELRPAKIAKAADTMTDQEVEMELLRIDNAELKERLQELEKSGRREEFWLERQREYESLLEEKSEVIRNLHLKVQELQDSVSCVNLGDAPAPAPGPASECPPTANISSSRLGQAEEILRLKHDLEEQRKQIQQDEEDMMVQMRQMELTMARERAELARQRQEIQRMQADLAREIEQSSRDPQLRERLNTLTRKPSLAAIPSEKPAAAAPVPGASPPGDQKGSGFFRRIFGK